MYNRYLNSKLLTSYFNALEVAAKNTGRSICDLPIEVFLPEETLELIESDLSEIG